MLMFLAGCVVACGALLVLAGAGKVYRGVRRTDGSSAVWRALRVPRRLVVPADVAFGVLECVTGGFVCARVDPVVSGVVLAVLGSAFCAVLAYIRIRRIPGDCGCVGLPKRANALAETVTWRAMTRAGLLAVAGVMAAVGSTTGFGVPFYVGVLTGAAVLTLLSTRTAPRTPVCRRALWRPVRSSVRALTAHELYATMASAAGPFSGDYTYRRTGCTDEFWFSAGAKTVVFRMSRTAPSGSLAVHATVHATVAVGQSS
jgi:hypothetical protein